MSAAKAKGTRWESDLVTYLAGVFRGRYGLEPRRVAQEGFLDTGDVHGIDPFVAQAKAYRSWEEAMRVGLDGAELQAQRAGRDYGVAFVKRPRRRTGEGYAVMRISTFARLLLRLRRAESMLSGGDAALHTAATAADQP